MAYPYIQARQHGGTQSHIERIVIHSTVGPTKCGSARGVANYFHITTRSASAHYVVDACEIIQCLTENTVAWHAPPNTGSIGVEICDNPGTWTNKTPVTRWDSGDHAKALELAAKVTREVAKRHGIPIVKLSPADLRAGRRGICGHIDVSNAFHMTDHFDPGNFPWSRFLQLVAGETGGEDDMPKYVSVGVDKDKPQQLEPGDWQTVAWPVSYSDSEDQHGGEGLSVLSGKAFYSLEAGVRVEGLPPGSRVLVRTVEVRPDPDGPDPVVQVSVPARRAVPDVDYANAADVVDAGNRVRVQVMVPAAATVTDGSCKVLFWR